MNKYQIRGKTNIMMKNILLTTFLLSGALQAQSSVGIDINTEDVEVFANYNLNSDIGLHRRNKYSCRYILSLQ